MAYCFQWASRWWRTPGRTPHHLQVERREPSSAHCPEELQLADAVGPRVDVVDRPHEQRTVAHRAQPLDDCAQVVGAQQPLLDTGAEQSPDVVGPLLPAGGVDHRPRQPQLGRLRRRVHVPLVEQPRTCDVDLAQVR